jgi:hypothetical protein
MNTGQQNKYGRTIFRGPRGGEYVLGFGGRKIRSFTRAPAAAPVAVAAAPGNTGQRNILGRVIHRGPRGGEYVLGPTGQKIRKFTKAPAAVAAPVAAALAKMLKLSNTEYINKGGILFNSQARIKNGLTHREYNNASIRAFNKDPNFLKKSVIPYTYIGRPNQALMTKLKLKNSTVEQRGRTSNGRNTGVWKKIYFNKKGDLYFISLNGKKHGVGHNMTQRYYKLKKTSKNIRNLKRVVGAANPHYPRIAIPLASPAVRRSSPELLNNMMNQIYTGGRGSNINAGRYTNAERNVLVRRLTSSIAYFRQHRNTKKAEAKAARDILRLTGPNGLGASGVRSRIAAANERVGYYDDAVRAYTRGLRAVKPLTGAVTPRARAMPNTPNRATPAPANVNVNAIYMPLNRPHLVVKTPGAGTIYLNPNTFVGYMKNAGRVNIAPANVRNWLRMARRNFPNEALFRHPLAAKNVTASQIRFSRPHHG